MARVTTEEQNGRGGQKELEEQVIAYWATRREAEPQNAFYQQGEMANEAGRVCIDNGFIYRGSYTGQYCVADELYINDARPGDRRNSSRYAVIVERRRRVAVRSVSGASGPDTR